MSARQTRHLGVYLRPVDVPRDPGLVATAVAQYFADRCVVPDRITVSTTTGIRTRKRVAQLPAAVVDASIRSFSVWRFPTKESRATTLISGYLRPTDVDDQRFQSRTTCVIWQSELQTVDEPLLTLVRSLAAAYPLAHGHIGSYRSRAYAGREVDHSMDSISEIDRDTDDRIHEDVMLDARSDHWLRRLYPVTIIGPDIWAKLPPMPAFDPMPRIDDLGDCKVLTVWPTLCEPRDPDFLRGTRALREWLWPYTIQNPADHVDNDPPPA